MGRRAQRACGKILLNLILKYGFPEVPWGSPGLSRFKGSLHGWSLALPLYPRLMLRGCCLAETLHGSFTLGHVFRGFLMAATLLDRFNKSTTCLSNNVVLNLLTYLSVLWTICYLDRYLLYSSCWSFLFRSAQDEMFNHGSYVCTSVPEVLSERLARSVVNNHGGFTLVCIIVFFFFVLRS